ncbi:MAG: MFS transporter [Lachnospiraceae bacterium]|nr:MFS transporter [uncultured Acetatifactor sp.]MCI9231614.1 MFS transporter [Lachnospiraceae bacterium]
MDKYRRTRILYILQADFEYFISLLVAGSFLAAVTAQLGISDSLTGVISAIISLGQAFQLLSISIRKNIKRKVVLFSAMNQLVFMCLYVIPLTGLPPGWKTALFIGAVTLAYFLYNIVHPKKIDWFMSMVEDGNRGRYTSVKEMVSLLTGMVFSYVMGSMSDYYRSIGQIRKSFAICAGVIFVLTVLHTLTMVLAAEKEEREGVSSGTGRGGRFGIIRDRNVLRVTAVLVIWHAANYVAVPFYGSYQIKELGFGLKYVSILGILYSSVRILFSFVWGAYADRRSFARMMRACMAVAAVGCLINVFTVPENGKLFFTTYYVCYAIAMAGIGNAAMNVVFDYVDASKRADALAVTQVVAGICGFATTLLASPLVTYVQDNGNMFLGMHVYAQQILSLLSCVLYLLAIGLITAMFCRRPGKG